MEIENNEGVLTPEQINELAEKARLADELKAKYEQAEKDKAGLVEELKVERQKKREAAEIAKTAIEGKADDPVVNTRSVVEDILKEERSKQIEMTRNQFEEKFKSSRPEFQAANDPAGIKWDAFKKTLGKLNVSSLSSIEEIEEAYDDAMLLLNKSKQEPKDQKINPYAFTPASKSGAKVEDSSGLDSKEKRLLETTGMSQEKYLKLKASQPAYVESLLRHVRD